MRLLIGAVGRAKAGPMRDLYDAYAARLSWRLTLKEIQLKRPLPPQEACLEEARQLLALLPGQPRPVLVALDGGGMALSSEALAGRIETWRDQGRADLAFFIGGAWGHGEAVLKSADLILSLGPMTWPHMLVRVMLAEQLYRAQQILAGHPYHHG